MDNINDKWWVKLGKPQYGGELTYRLNRKIVNLDPYYGCIDTNPHGLDGKTVCRRLDVKSGDIRLCAKFTSE